MGIPLDPGAGGRSIDTNALETADILVSTTPGGVSLGIRFGTFSPVSHARLYVGGGQVVEAVGEGVVLAQVSDVLRTDSLCVAYRKPGLTQTQRLLIRDYVGRQLGKGYDTGGVAAVGLTTPIGVAASAAAIAISPVGGAILTARILLAGERSDRFFCSELVLGAYREAGVPLAIGSPEWSSPDDIRELWASGGLEYVGHLKA